MHLRRELRRIAVSLALMLPSAIPYVVHLADQRPYSLPTGYIQADMPLYMAKAREAFDAGKFGLLYGNPCDAFSDQPRIYFQPWTFMLGLVHHLTAIRSGVLWVGFWLLSALLASRVFVAVFEAWVGLETRSKRLALVAFFWGGGVLAIAGMIRGLLLRGGVSWDDLTAFDPFKGWWFLNLGRNLVYPTEALYHALAFASFLMAQPGRSRIASLALATLTAMCSPFAGLETLAILWTAGLVESFASIHRRRALQFFLGVNVLCVFFVTYYLVFLNQFAEHQALSRGMMLSWRYSWGTCLAAYGPVFLLAAWRFRSWDRARIIVMDSRGRFLIAWAFAAFALENHDLILSPRQPIHFTRGYVWAALFLLGTPTLLSIFNSWPNVRSFFARRGFPTLSILIPAILMTVILADNMTWFAVLIHEYKVPDRNGLRLSRQQWEIVDRLNHDDFLGYLLVSEDERISYIALAETRLRPLLGHPLETPEYEIRREEVRRFFERRKFAGRWRGFPLVIVVYRPVGSGIRLKRGGRLVFENGRFQILQFDVEAAERNSIQNQEK